MYFFTQVFLGKPPFICQRSQVKDVADDCIKPAFRRTIIVIIINSSFQSGDISTATTTAYINTYNDNYNIYLCIYITQVKKIILIFALQNVSCVFSNSRSNAILYKIFCHTLN